MGQLASQRDAAADQLADVSRRTLPSAAALELLIDLREVVINPLVFTPQLSDICLIQIVIFLRHFIFLPLIAHGPNPAIDVPNFRRMLARLLLRLSGS
jgi:hypothetical protein